MIYCAAEAWQERLAWLDFPLSEMARKEPFVNLMPLITSEYDSEIYDKYDIAGMDKDELLSACDMIVRDKEYDEVTNEVLCWGLLKTVEEERRLEVEIETVASDGTLLKGVLTDQSRAWTSIRMESPYEVSFCKSELIRDAEAFMIQNKAAITLLKEITKEIILPRKEDTRRWQPQASGPSKDG